MKKVLLALFLMFGFVSANSSTTNFEFKITDENGQEQSTTSNGSELNITPGRVGQYYKIKATNLSPNAELSVKNGSGGNILLRFNAGVTSKSQIIYQVSNGNGQKSFASDYYALSSCQVDKNPQNRPTRSFLIMNNNDKKFLKFSLRDCDTGTIKNNNNNAEKLDLNTKLLVLNTQMNDSSFDPKVKNDSKAYGLPTMIIGEERLIDLSTKSAKGGEEFLCMTRDNIQSLTLYDGSGNNIDSFTSQSRKDSKNSKINFIDGRGSKINFTIKNNPGTNYRKMYFKLTCKNMVIKDGVIIQSGSKEQLYYFDARPKAIKVSDLPNNNEWLYAEQKYNSDGTAYDDEFSKAIKDQKGSLTKDCVNCKVIKSELKSKTMNRITLTPVDAHNQPVTAYSSIGEIAIIGKIYGDGTDAISSSSDANIINETNDRKLIRPCVAGSRAGCEIAIAEINGATKKSEIYTGIVNNTKVLAYNNVGPTVLYGADTEWTKYSQNYTADSSSTPSKSPLCVHGESHSYLKRVNIKGTNYDLVGCNIPFVNEKDGDELNFYFFKPAVYKLLFEGKNSPTNNSYGTDKLTYIHTIEPNDYDAAKNEIFEAADFNPSILAIGASLESLKNDRALSHYDNHLTVANQLTFSGNPANPTITISRSNKTSDIAEDFSITAKNNTDISDAIMLTLEPKNPYNDKGGYKGSHVSKEITTDDKGNITIDMRKNNFYAGKNTKDNKLNFKREDLLARNYVNIGKSRVNININDTNNAALKKTIEDGKAAFIFSYTGDELHFVDAAIIAPNVASNGTAADGAVYLAGYCDPTSHATCKNSGIFIPDAIAGHINYFGFNSLAYGRDTNITESTTNGLFGYDKAQFVRFKRGADFLGNFTADEVKIELQGDKAREYCKIFRNCHELGNSKFGTVFNSYKAKATQWHGDGDQQGDTIVDRTTSGRKEQRLNF